MRSREALRVFLALVLIASLIAAAIGWANDKPDEQTWLLRVGGLVAALAAIAGFLMLTGRCDEVPDYLFDRCGKYFDRDSFCFSFVLGAGDRVATLRAWFQNRCDRPCSARIHLRPKRGLLGRAKFPPVEVHVSCQPAAFGFVDQPLAIPAGWAGKTIEFEVGVSVEWPESRGQTLRFRDGIPVRTDAEFRNRMGCLLSSLGLLGGMLVISRAPGVKLQLPSETLGELPPGLESTQETIWRLDDPPLETP